MSSKIFTLSALVISILEWWLFPIFHGQLRINLLAAFVLSAAFLDQDFSRKMFFAGLLLLALEFKSSGTWGLMTLAVFLTIAIFYFVEKVVIISKQNAFFSIFWLVCWYYLFAILWGELEALVSWGKTGVDGRIFYLWSGKGLAQILGWASLFLIYYQLTKKSRYA